MLLQNSILQNPNSLTTMLFWPHFVLHEWIKSLVARLSLVVKLILPTGNHIYFLFSYTAEIGNDECCIKTCSDEQKQLPIGTTMKSVIPLLIQWTIFSEMRQTERQSMISKLWLLPDLYTGLGMCVPSLYKILPQRILYFFKWAPMF